MSPTPTRPPTSYIPAVPEPYPEPFVPPYTQPTFQPILEPAKPIYTIPEPFVKPEPVYVQPAPTPGPTYIKPFENEGKCSFYFAYLGQGGASEWRVHSH